MKIPYAKGSVMHIKVNKYMSQGYSRPQAELKAVESIGRKPKIKTRPSYW